MSLHSATPTYLPIIHARFDGYSEIEVKTRPTKSALVHDTGLDIVQPLLNMSPVSLRIVACGEVKLDPEGHHRVCGYT